MPQATDEHRDRWHGPGEQYAIDFLQRRGYFLRRDWTWRPVNRPPTPDEIDAVNFLVEEWDFGSIEIRPDEMDANDPAPMYLRIVHFPFDYKLMRESIYALEQRSELTEPQRKLLHELEDWLRDHE